MENTLHFKVWSADNRSAERAVSIKRIYCGRYCDRDIDARRKSLDQMRAKGYTIHGNPNTCRRSRYLLTNEETIEVQGPQTSGEVEIVAIMDAGEIFISVGSDHNDRTLDMMWTEALGRVFDTAKAKQMAPAVVAKEAWRYEDVKDYWDQLNLRSYVTVSGEEIPYQNFALSELVDLEYHFKNQPELRDDGVVLFGGSRPALQSVPPNVYHFQSSFKDLIFPTAFRFEVHDPTLNRKISHKYTAISVENPGSLSL